MGKSSKLQTGTVFIPQNASKEKTKILYNLLITSAIKGNFSNVQKWINQGAKNVNVNVRFEDDFATLTPIVATLMGKSWHDKNDQNEDYFKIFKLLIESSEQ